MSHAAVERIVGRLVTDERFRVRFGADPEATLRQLAGEGLELNPCELAALAALDVGLVAALADRLDPRILKCDLRWSRDEERSRGEPQPPRPCRSSRV